MHAAPRLLWDLEALDLLMSPVHPPEVVVRTRSVFTILYGFGDASGKRFGSTFLEGSDIRYHIGTWESDAEDDSSSWKEFENMVWSLEEEARDGKLVGALVYLFTDNSTVEAVFFKGNSTSRKLFNLVVRLRKLELAQGAKFVISHCSGERMKAQGTDGVSRGQLKEGITSGADMHSFIPINKTPLDREESLRSWITSWAGPEVKFLDLEGWFERGHDQEGGSVDDQGFWRHNLKPGVFIWIPAPIAAEVAIKELRNARIKQQDSMHIFVCPRLLTPEWLKQLFKASDVAFPVPPGFSFWPQNMYEPLTIGIIFPFINSPPWQIRGTPKMFSVGRKMRSLCKEENLAPGNFCANFYWNVEGFTPCRKMWCGGCYISDPKIKFHVRTLADEPGENEKDVRDKARLAKAWSRKTRSPTDFHKARNGDHVMILFECDLCIFRKLRGHSQLVDNPRDPLLTDCIRRMNLDAFWSRATTTVNGNRDHLAFGLKLLKLVGLDGPYLHEGPMPAYDYCEYEVAVQMLLNSRNKGV